MSSYTVPQAAAAVGRNRSSLLRAIKAGKLSAMRDEASGDWRIDPAELHRLYPPRPEMHAQDAVGGNAPSRSIDAAVEIAELRARLEAVEHRFTDAQDVIRNLWQRLDAETEERRRLTALLADQRPAAPAPVPPPPAPRRWWNWRRQG
jgi:hypothetical protein